MEFLRSEQCVEAATLFVTSKNFHAPSRRAPELYVFQPREFGQQVCHPADGEQLPNKARFPFFSGNSSSRPSPPQCWLQPDFVELKLIDGPHERQALYYLIDFEERTVVARLSLDGRLICPLCHTIACRCTAAAEDKQILFETCFGDPFVVAQAVRHFQTTYQGPAPESHINSWFAILKVNGPLKSQGTVASMIRSKIERYSRMGYSGLTSPKHLDQEPSHVTAPSKDTFYSRHKLAIDFMLSESNPSNEVVTESSGDDELESQRGQYNDRPERPLVEPDLKTARPRAFLPALTRRCDTCGSTFGRSADLVRHVKTVHRRERKFRCHICDKRFLQKTHMTAHVRSVHDKAKPFKCDHCDGEFTRKASLKKHISSAHHACHY